MFMDIPPHNPHKHYVDVIAVFFSDGKLNPLKIRMEDGAVFSVDRILDIRRAASLKAGGQGMRYTCRIDGKEAYLFYEAPRWFLESE